MVDLTLFLLRDADRRVALGLCEFGKTPRADRT
jgi:hypothetical protein